MLSTKKLDNGDYRIEAELTSLPNLNSPQTYVNAQGEEKTYYIANAKIATMNGKEMFTSVSIASKTLDNANKQGGFTLGNHYLATGRIVQREGSKPVILIQLSHLPFGGGIVDAAEFDADFEVAEVAAEDKITAPKA